MASATDQEWFNTINQEGQDEIITWEIIGDLTQVDVDGLKDLWFRDLPLKRARLQSVWANLKRQQGIKRTMTTVNKIIKQNYSSFLLMSYFDYVYLLTTCLIDPLFCHLILTYFSSYSIFCFLF
jgi:hypothetical protein